VIDHFYSDVVGHYWPPERRYVEEGYRTLPFPWPDVPHPPFSLETCWDLDQVIGYLATWSSVQRFKDSLGLDPLPELRATLVEAWPRGEPRALHWPIHLRLGHA
jgi:hypothetical protein